MHIKKSVVGVMKIGNIVPRAGIEPTPRAFQASVLRYHHIGIVVTSGSLTVYGAHCLRGQFTVMNCKSFIAYSYIHTDNGLMHPRQERFNNHSVHSLYGIMVMVTSVVGVIKMEILYPEWDSNPHLWHPRPVCYNFML